MVAGAEWGRIRALIDDTGKHVPYAGPSVPVEVLGFNGTPDAGDRVIVVPNEARAREVTEYRARIKRERLNARTGGANRSLVDMMREAKEGANRKELPIIIKGDVQGSVEAIVGALTGSATTRSACASSSRGSAASPSRTSRSPTPPRRW